MRLTCTPVLDEPPQSRLQIGVSLVQPREHGLGIQLAQPWARILSKPEQRFRDFRIHATPVGLGDPVLGIPPTPRPGLGADKR